MKKITILAIAALAISFASCKKDRTCTCVSTPTSGTATTTKTVYYKAKKHDVRNKCVGYQTTTENSGVTSTGSNVTCELK